jgi:predicted deacetylase
MKPFLDAGFLLTLLLKTSGSRRAWEVSREVEGPLLLSSFQVLSVINRFRRELEADDSTAAQRAHAANALQNFTWYLEQQVFRTVRLDYEIAFDLAYQWQRHSKKTPTTMLLLWPAIAVTTGATHFLSFDPRTRQLAQTAGLQVLPQKL